MITPKYIYIYVYILVTYIYIILYIMQKCMQKYVHQYYKMDVLTAYIAKTNFDYLYIPWSFLSYLQALLVKSKNSAVR